jgi:L-lactate dehydrogenase complex protein LldF
MDRSNAVGGELPIFGTKLRDRSADRVADQRLGRTLAAATDQFAERKATAYAQFADPDAVRAAARAAKRAVLERLPEVLAELADRLEANGVTVHWASDDAEARRFVREIIEADGGRRVVKSKSMLSEEIGLNRELEAAGMEITETDLGEWIIQLARETPSHIIVPAIHKDRGRSVTRSNAWRTVI